MKECVKTIESKQNQSGKNKLFTDAQEPQNASDKSPQTFDFSFK